ncbi:hypothetical protein EV138_3299 [Kribbella voronezhensis]|uniref:ABC transporter family protein n=1 Tax=Kribbella voronezhensis TaxID=2512212 RepID=A0A4V6Q5X9_9ACTN|nr:hypothetical protein [Kribbella voronezhensis]TDU89723.1 hypothetical protein EV138_3299 [Kribbella voronezhensis]
MELKAHAISVQGPHAPMLNATSVSVGDHQLVLLAGYPGPGHVAASLALSGRLRPNGGDVKLDGQTDGGVLRRRVAVVDAPGITEPDDALPVRSVVGEELAIAGRKAGGKAVLAWLEEHGWHEYADKRFEHLPVAVRTKLLAELTVARPEVKVVILTMPDRHGGDPHEWYGMGRALASRGYGVIITCADASARLLAVPAAQLGSLTPPEPVQVAAVEPVEPTEKTKVDPTAETKPNPMAKNPEPVVKAEPVVETTTEPGVKAKSQPGAGTKADPGAEPGTAAEGAAVGGTKAEPGAEPGTAAEAAVGGTKPVVKAQSEPVAGTTVEPVGKTKPEPVAKPVGVVADEDGAEAESVVQGESDEKKAGA